MKKFLFALMLGLGTMGLVTACEGKKEEADTGQQAEEPADASSEDADSGDAADSGDVSDTGDSDAESSD